MSTAPASLREQIIAACHQLEHSGLNRGTAGNISCREDAHFLITPSGMPVNLMRPDRLVQMPQRVDALLKIKGMLVNPNVVVKALDARLGATPYMVTVLQAGPGQGLSGDVIRLQTESELSDILKLSLMQCVKEACGITPEVQFVPARTLMTQGANWKVRKFVDLRVH